ncbi:ribose 5-phosphate isomerase-related [Anaeramoeba flamelloides]|uniref:Ribose 5-phosphate isomerase-related n=1 Tax=Anaeramoeba flamelloides TaxID=1746091 RepID=A0AAV7YFX1_9EUKA|nr:ribose 5-phosphate isomerase-related [Anaeramoeba flamelloides]KAJ6228605.1 ribose 5-phosphate isomerase-related [Anaeramoeba flamelloides]
MNKVVIASDHGGFALKLEVIKHLKSKNIAVEDVGTHNEESCDYPDIAGLLCKKITNGEYERGILICGTGIGISIAANKHKGIYCAVVHDHFTAKMCVRHNNANVIAFGGRVIGIEIAKEIVDVFISEEFESGRHNRRVNKIKEIEKNQESIKN